MNILNKLFGKKEKTHLEPNHDSNNNVSPRSEPKTSSIYSYYELSDLKTIPFSGNFSLRPIDAGVAFEGNDCKLIEVLASMSPNVRKFLPNMNLETEENVSKFLQGICIATEAGFKFAYTIRQNNGICGLIFVQTPSYNKSTINFPHWTIDFCVFGPFEGKGLMKASLARMLYFLKTSLHVDDLYAVVDKDNNRSNGLLGSLPFDLQTETMRDANNGHLAYIYKCPLSEIQFR